jgi:hypothetical protein
MHDTYGTGSTSNMFFERDQEKKKMCIEKGVSLVYIPYWYYVYFVYFIYCYSNWKIVFVIRFYLMKLIL